jgi:hypothetical protein
VFRPSDIARFVVVFAMLYAASIALWSSVAEPYGAFYRSTVQTIIHLGDREKRVSVRPARMALGAPNGPVLDTQIICRLPGEPGTGRNAPAEREFVSDRSSRYSGYAPLTLTLCLILATPLAWKRRAIAAFWGALAVTWFTALIPALQVYPLYLSQEGHWLFGPLPFLYAPWHALVFALSKITRWSTLYYMVPFVIWTVVSFRLREVSEFVERFTASSMPAPNERD